MKKKILSFVLILGMTTSLTPAIAFANENTIQIQRTGYLTEPAPLTNESDEYGIMTLAATGPTSAEAFKEAVSSEDQEKVEINEEKNKVTLSGDVKITKTIDVVDTLTLELGSHSITFEEVDPENTKTIMFDIKANGSLTFNGNGAVVENKNPEGNIVHFSKTGTKVNVGENVTLKSSNKEGGIVIWIDNLTAETENPQDITIDVSGTLISGDPEKQYENGWFAIYGWGVNTKFNMDINLHPTAKLYANTAIYAPCKSDITVEDGAYVEGYSSGIEIRRGDLTINGGIIKANYRDLKVTMNGGKPGATLGGTTVEGAAVTVNPSIGAGDYVKVSMSKGELIGNTGLVITDSLSYNTAEETDRNVGKHGDNVTINITGGTIKGDEASLAVVPYVTTNSQKYDSSFESNVKNNDSDKGLTITGGSFIRGEEGNPDGAIVNFLNSAEYGVGSDGTVKKAEDVKDDLFLVDFGYIAEKSTFTADKDNWRSPGRVTYKTETAQWDDGTFYWCFNRELTDDEIKQTENGYPVTFESPDGKFQHTDYCNSTESPRFASSILNKDQFGEEVPLLSGNWILKVADQSFVIPVSIPDSLREKIKAAFIETGFLAEGGDKSDEYLNSLAPLAKGSGKDWSKKVEDTINNTLYAVFQADGTDKDGSGSKYTVIFTDANGKKYSEDLEGVTLGGIIYFSPTDQDAEKGDIPVKDFQGKYTVTLIKDESEEPVSESSIEIYQVTYKAGEGVTGDDIVVYTNSNDLSSAQQVDHSSDFPLNSGETKLNKQLNKINEYTYEIVYSGSHTTNTPSNPGSNPGSSTPTQTQTVNPQNAIHGSFALSSQNAKAGDTVTVTPKAEDGYEVDQIVVTDKNGNKVEVKDNGDGTFSFVMPEAAAHPVSVSVTFKEKASSDEPGDEPTDEHNCPSEKFTDFDKNAWYHEGIDYAVENGILKGKTATTIAPNDGTKRAEVVTMIYRLNHEPAAGTPTFLDTPANVWYSNAVAWAKENGVTTGYNNNLFGPDDSMSREQLATFLYRYAKAHGQEVSASRDLSSFPDANQVSEFAKAAMQWAVEKGIIVGQNQTNLAPASGATRAETATMLMRFAKLNG